MTDRDRLIQMLHAQAMYFEALGSFALAEWMRALIAEVKYERL